MVGLELDCPTCGQKIIVPQSVPPTQIEKEAENPNGSSVAPIDAHANVNDKEEAPPPVIVVVKKRESFFSLNRKWLLPVVGSAAALAVIARVALGKSTSREHRPPERTSFPAPPERTSPASTSTSSDIYSNSRQFVKDHIKKNENCRIVAITQTGGDIVVCGDNDWAASGCSKTITDTLQEISGNGSKIVDVCLTEKGRFVVLYDRNAGNWNDIPFDMEYHLRSLNADNEELYSATLNDAGDWIVVGSEHYACSATWLKAWLADGGEKYGILRAAAVSTDAAVAVYDRGFKFFGNVPEDLKTALREADFDVQIIKIAGAAWFFASKYGYSYRAKM